MNFEDVTPLIENVLILDSDGKRIAVKYYGEAKCVGPIALMTGPATEARACHCRFHGRSGCKATLIVY